MSSIKINLSLSDLPFFDKFLHQELIKSPVESLRVKGQYLEDLKLYERNYEIQVKKGERKVEIQIKLTAKSDKINPLKISIKSPAPKSELSEKEMHEILDIIVSRIKEAEKSAIKKPMKTYEFEARLSSDIYPLRSTVEFGKYKIVSSEKKDTQGLEFKLKFTEEGIDKDFATTDATIEAKIVAAWLTLIFSINVVFKGFSEITADPKVVTHYETIKRPDLRPIKHSFARELKIPRDFIKLWNNFDSLPPKIKEAFVSSCMCYQVAMELRYTYPALSYQLFVTAIEVIANKTVSFVGVQRRFIEFICINLSKSDKKFRSQLQDCYSLRSSVVHEKGVGLRFIPLFDIRSFELIPAGKLWTLEIIVNAALINFLENPFEIVTVKKDLLSNNHT